MAKNTSTAENQGDQAGGVDPNLGSQAQRAQSVPHVDVLKCDMLIQLPINMADLAAVPNAQKAIADIIAAAEKAGGHVTSITKLGRAKETLFAPK